MGFLEDLLDNLSATQEGYNDSQADTGEKDWDLAKQLQASRPVQAGENLALGLGKDLGAILTGGKVTNPFSSGDSGSGLKSKAASSGMQPESDAMLNGDVQVMHDVNAANAAQKPMSESAQKLQSLLSMSHAAPADTYVGRGDDIITGDGHKAMSGGGYGRISSPDYSDRGYNADKLSAAGIPPQLAEQVSLVSKQDPKRAGDILEVYTKRDSPGDITRKSLDELIRSKDLPPQVKLGALQDKLRSLGFSDAQLQQKLPSIWKLVQQLDAKKH